MSKKVFDKIAEGLNEALELAKHDEIDPAKAASWAKQGEIALRSMPPMPYGTVSEIAREYRDEMEKARLPYSRPSTVHYDG